jgi:hypothetical protein
MDVTRNPYQDGGEPKLKNSVVVFMDILGYKDMAESASMKNSEGELLLRLHSALRDGQKFLKGSQIGNKDFYALKAFTDNIVIGWPIWDDAEMELGTLFFMLEYFQFNLALEGIFIRGGLTIGPLYMDDITVFGAGLNEAYYVESYLTRDPRIVLSLKAEEAVKTHMGYYGRPEHAPQARDLYRDSDGQLFLNYLDTVMLGEDEVGPFLDDLMKHKSIVEQQLEKHKDRPNIWSKYAWVANYHNFFCEQYPHYFTADYSIEQSIIRLVPATLY